MKIKDFTITIRAPEELATNFIDLICLAEGFKSPTQILPDAQEETPITLTADELFQHKLNFIGVLAGKHLRNIAESKRMELELQAKREELSQQNAQMGSLFTVLPVEIKGDE